MSDLASIAENMAKAGATPHSTGAADRKPPPSRGGNKDAAAKETPTTEVVDTGTKTGTDDAANTDAPDNGGGTPDVTKTEPINTGGGTVATRSATMATVAVMADRQTAGDLVQVRVQPPDLGSWMNEVLDTVAFAFNARRGDVAGAVFGLVRGHFDEFVDVMEGWAGGPPTDKVRHGVWLVLKQQEADRTATIVDGNAK